jgi:hypothetical protein
MGSSYSIRLFLAAMTCAALLLPAAAPTAGAQSARGQERGWRLGQDRNDYERGYRAGLREGEQDARRGRAYDVQRDPRFGARDDFRRGFAEGYRAGFERARVRGDARVFGNGREAARRAGGYQEPASARGYSDGYARGLSDGRDHDRYDPVGERDYRDGDNGYSGAYGSKDAYKNNYRAGFRQGYEEGYRDGTSYRR